MAGVGGEEHYGARAGICRICGQGMRGGTGQQHRDGMGLLSRNTYRYPSNGEQAFVFESIVSTMYSTWDVC